MRTFRHETQRTTPEAQRAQNQRTDHRSKVFSFRLILLRADSHSWTSVKVISCSPMATRRPLIFASFGLRDWQ